MSNLIPIALCERALETKDKQIAELQAELTKCKAEADRLKAEVERLTKAGVDPAP